MNTSNTKINSNQKTWRKEMLKLLQEKNGEIFSFPACNCTIVVVPEFTNSNMVRVSISYSSDNELKFRPKVGQYYALQKMFNEGDYIKLPIKYYEFFEIADSIAQLCD